ncbi:MAG: ubiquinol-cytochrome c reductase iron-sulfur subunit [Nitrososphaerales archaeon]
MVKVRRVKIANKKDVQTDGRLMFSYPTETRPALLLHIGPDEYDVGNYWEESRTVILKEDQFVAYDGICTHLGCPVGWLGGEKKMGPSCHGARFSPVDGTVRAGPPRRQIPKIKLEIDAEGDIYANGYESGLPLFGWEERKLEFEG